MGENNNNNKELSARMMAVQAYYQTAHNAKPVRTVVQEYLEQGLLMDIDGEEVKVKPHGGLFKRILLSLDERLAEVNEILISNTHKKDQDIPVANDDGEDSEEEVGIVPPPEKELEPLLKAILLCGVCELLAHQDIDAPLIIDDYLNVTHAFYEQQQVSFVNGILHNAASALRD